ncbi:MAG: hypothetical protein Q8K92_13560 [Leadbetterella sp.]|nr:hypothetical protein [Leadbetterella sp.]
MTKLRSKKFWMFVSSAVAAGSAGLSILMFGGDLWFLTIAICAGAISVYLSKSVSKEEREKQDEISAKAFVASILIPIGVVLLLLLVVVAMAIWKTYK